MSQPETIAPVATHGLFRHGPRVRILKRCLLALTALIAVVVVVGWARGSAWQVERSAVLRASALVVHARVADLGAWSRWAAGPEHDACAWSTSGSAGAVGSSVRWRGAACGEGALVLADASVGRGLWLRSGSAAESAAGVDGADGAASPGSASQTAGGTHVFTFESMNDGVATQVTWKQQGDLDALAGGWLTGWFEERIGAQMEAALARLAREFEGAAAAPVTAADAATERR